MPVSFLIRHWKKELQVFHVNLLLLQNSSSSEAIHDLRVSIKKLRSYTKLYSALFKNNQPAPRLADTKKLFSALGKQRNIEICMQSLRPFQTKPLLLPIHKHFEFYLKETTQRSASALQEYTPGGLRSMTIEIEKTVFGIDDEVLKPHLLKLIRSCIDDVRRQLKDFNKHYHLARKNLKDIFYWCQILPADFYFSKLELKTLKSILDDLGDLQDHEVLRTNLQHYRKTVLGKGDEEYADAKKIEEKISKNKQGLLDKAGGIIREILKSR